MKFVIISDNHNYYDMKVPEGDVLIHCGDFSFRGDPLEVLEFQEWIKKQPHKHKLFVWGNHEVWVEQNYSPAVTLVSGGICVHNIEKKVEGLRVLGSSVTPPFGRWAFMMEKDRRKKYWETLPECDILITHGPPLEILDLNIDGEHCGCGYMREYVDRVKPKLHCFGHIHESYGQYEQSGTLFVNASVMNERYKPVNMPIEVGLKGI